MKTLIESYVMPGGWKPVTISLFISMMVWGGVHGADPSSDITQEDASEADTAIEEAKNLARECKWPEMKQALKKVPSETLGNVLREGWSDSSDSEESGLRRRSASGNDEPEPWPFGPGQTFENAQDIFLGASALDIEMPVSMLETLVEYAVEMEVSAPEVERHLSEKTLKSKELSSKDGKSWRSYLLARNGLSNQGLSEFTEAHLKQLEDVLFFKIIDWVLKDGPQELEALKHSEALMVRYLRANPKARALRIVLDQFSSHGQIIDQLGEDWLLRAAKDFVGNESVSLRSFTFAEEESQRRRRESNFELARRSFFSEDKNTEIVRDWITLTRCLFPKDKQPFETSKDVELSQSIWTFWKGIVDFVVGVHTSPPGPGDEQYAPPLPSAVWMRLNWFTAETLLNSCPPSGDFLKSASNAGEMLAAKARLLCWEGRMDELVPLLKTLKERADQPKELWQWIFEPWDAKPSALCSRNAALWWVNNANWKGYMAFLSSLAPYLDEEGQRNAMATACKILEARRPLQENDLRLISLFDDKFGWKDSALDEFVSRFTELFLEDEAHSEAPKESEEAKASDRQIAKDFAEALRRMKEQETKRHSWQVHLATATLSATSAQFELEVQADTGKFNERMKDVLASLKAASRLSSGENETSQLKFLEEWFALSISYTQSQDSSSKPQDNADWFAAIEDWLDSLAEKRAAALREKFVLRQAELITGSAQSQGGNEGAEAVKITEPEHRYETLRRIQSIAGLGGLPATLTQLLDDASKIHEKVKLKVDVLGVNPVQGNGIEALLMFSLEFSSEAEAIHQSFERYLSPGMPPGVQEEETAEVDYPVDLKNAVNTAWSGAFDVQDWQKCPPTVIATPMEEGKVLPLACFRIVTKKKDPTRRTVPSVLFDVDFDDGYNNTVLSIASKELTLPAVPVVRVENVTRIQTSLEPRMALNGGVEFKVVTNATGLSPAPASLLDLQFNDFGAAEANEQFELLMDGRTGKVKTIRTSVFALTWTGTGSATDFHFPNLLPAVEKLTPRVELTREWHPPGDLRNKSESVPEGTTVRLADLPSPRSPTLVKVAVSTLAVLALALVWAWRRRARAGNDIAIESETGPVQTLATLALIKPGASIVDAVHHLRAACAALQPKLESGKKINIDQLKAHREKLLDEMEAPGMSPRTALPEATREQVNTSLQQVNTSLQES